MPRPTLLIAEPEPEQALSVRKLVLETGKFNVLTAHSTREAIDLFHLFPNVSAAVAVEGSGVDCEEISKAIKTANQKVPLIYLSPRIGGKCATADYNLSSHEPEELLNRMRSLLGDPRQIDIQNREQ